jgi:dihydrofolate synthase/folylpolyglutamate synthase
MLLDGAHNLAGARALISTFGELFPNEHPTLILGILQDKDWAEMCRLLAPLAKRAILVPVNSIRATEPSALAGPCADANPAATVEICASVQEALRRAESDSFLVVTGSLYLVGEVLEKVGSDSAPRIGERALNEWSVRA